VTLLLPSAEEVKVGVGVGVGCVRGGGGRRGGSSEMWSGGGRGRRRCWRCSGCGGGVICWSLGLVRLPRGRVVFASSAGMGM
jgi:hypothetical protein